MKLFAGKVTPIATEVVRALLAAETIEAESPREVEKDVESVLKNYLEIEREVNERAKDVIERTGRDSSRGGSDFNRVRGLVADEKGIKVGDDTLDYLLDQVVEIFHHSQNVDEIYGEDVELRRRMAPIFKKHMAADAALDAEARAQIKNLREGTREFEIEYMRQIEIAKRKKGLT